MPIKKDPRALVIDIESAPVEAYVWGLWDQNIGLDFIKTDWTILSFAAQWLGEKKIIYSDTGGRGVSKVRDDKGVVGEIRELLDEAELVIAQNGKGFDVRKINARLITHGYGPPSPYHVVDTMLVAKKHFAFTSQKLAYTSKLLTDSPKSEHKKFPGFELWVECLKDNPLAWAEMKKYNKQDIVSTAKVYYRLRPWMDQHPNVAKPSEIPCCPKCGSDRMKRNTGPRITATGQRYPRFQCMNCGGWSRGKMLLLPLKTRKQMLIPN